MGEDRADHIDLNFGCPVPEGHPQGRWGRAAVEARPLRGPRDEDRSRLLGRPGHGEDAQGHRRRPPDLPRRRPHRARRRRRRDLAARPHGERALLGHADWSAIATLKETITDIPVLGNGDIWSAGRRPAHGRRDRLRRGGRRSWLPRSPVVVRRPRGGVPRRGRPCDADARRGRGRVPSARRAPGRVLRVGRPRLPRRPQARGVVLQGVPDRRRRPVRPRDGVEPAGDRRPARRARLDGAVPGRRRRGPPWACRTPEAHRTAGPMARVARRRRRVPESPRAAELHHSGG